GLGRLHHPGQRAGQNQDGSADRVGGGGDYRSPLGASSLVLPEFAGASHCTAVDLADGGVVAAICHRLLRGILEEDRPPCRKAPQVAFLCTKPAQEAQRCPRTLKDLTLRPQCSRASIRRKN